MRSRGGAALRTSSVAARVVVDLGRRQVAERGAAVVQRLRPRRRAGGRSAPRTSASGVGVEQVAQLVRSRAARAAARGRATAPARGARPAARRPRTCTARRSRTAATRRTASRTASRPRPARSRGARRPRAAGRRRRRQVEHVLQALAVRLEHDRERAEALGHLQQRLRLQALLPERRALARPAARDQQRAGGVLAEPRAVQRGAAELAHDQVLDRLGVERDSVGRTAGRRRRAGAGRCRRPTTAPASRRRARSRSSAPSARAHGACTRPPNGDEDAQAPVADLVAEALHDDGAVGRQHARRVELVGAGSATGSRAARSSRSWSATSRFTALRLGQRAESRARTRRSRGRARPGGPAPRPARTGSGPAGPARGRRARGRG